MPFERAVELVPVGISRDDYLGVLGRCNMLLLPYDEKEYPPQRGSGVALEALLTARPMSATANTYAAELITEESGAVGVDVDAIAQAVVRVAENYERYLPGATKGQCERSREL